MSSRKPIQPHRLPLGMALGGAWAAGVLTFVPARH